MIKLGDNVVPYNDQFRFFLTTKLANPHYTPEIQVKVSLVNFTITQGGLEEQLLHVVVGEELPELATQRANLVIDNANRNKQLFDIESEILYLLSNSTGNILDDTVLNICHTCELHGSANMLMLVIADNSPCAHMDQFPSG